MKFQFRVPGYEIIHDSLTQQQKKGKQEKKTVKSPEVTGARIYRHEEGKEERKGGRGKGEGKTI
jgi:hypothetical protein